MCMYDVYDKFLLKFEINKLIIFIIQFQKNN